MDALKKKCTNETTIIRHLEQDKNKLQMQVKRLQSNFQDVMSQFEKTSDTQEEEIRKARLNSDEQQKQIDSLQDEVTSVEEALKVSREKATVELDDMLNYTQQTTRRLNLEHEQQTLALRHEFKEETSKLNKVIQSLDSQVNDFESSKADSIDKHNDAHQKLDSLSELISTLKCTLENEKKERDKY
jgi:chromosome segregation ATPase